MKNKNKLIILQCLFKLFQSKKFKKYSKPIIDRHYS